MAKLNQENFIVTTDEQFVVSDPANYTVRGTNERIVVNADAVEHFETLEIVMPYVSGTCTIPEGVNWSQGYHTPLTCREPSNGEWTYYFGTVNVPIGFFQDDNYLPIYRQIKTITESTPEIKPAGGLASRGSLRVSFNDFEGDPGPVNTTTTGTYFQKIVARNIFSNRTCTIKRWARKNGVDSLVSSSVYISESLTVTNKGDYNLQCKSQLEYTYKDSTQFPEPTGALLRTDIDNTVTQIPVNDADYEWIAGIVIRIGDELMSVTAYDSGLEELTVDQRGTSIVGTSVTISTTEADDHSAGDDIQVCWVSDDEEIADLLSLVLTLSGIPSSYIDTTAWQAEIDDYWADSVLNMVWSEPEAVSDILDIISNDYMLDIWEDSNSPSSIKVSAVSAWKETAMAIETGQGITQETLRLSPKPDMRSSRAYIYYDKTNKTDNDDRGNYKKLALNIDLTYEGTDYYGTQKESDLGFSTLLNTNDASLRTQRQTARFSLSPIAYDWECEEKYIDYQVGEIVDITNRDITDAEGVIQSIRAQITKINPKYKKEGVGRGYAVKALTYTPAIISGGTGEFTKVVTGSTLSEIDIHNDYADRTTTIVDFTLILDNCTIVSDDLINPSIRNGSFTDGSTVTIILTNGTDWQSLGGEGGTGGSWYYDQEFLEWRALGVGNGGDGGVCFNADGVETNIYLSGSTGNASYPTANGSIRAGGGGGSGSSGTPSQTGAGNGGGGGAGNNIGIGGSGGTNTFFAQKDYGDQGGNGTDTGTGGSSNYNGGDWGDDGEAEFGRVIGLAGSGIIKSGAIVYVNGATASNFINGNGDTPD